MVNELTFWWYWILANSEDLRNIALLAALVSVPPFLAWRAWLGRGDERRALHRAEAEKQAREAQQLSTMFAQLGSDQVAVRIAAVHTLEQIARDYPRMHGAIMQTLGAFIREQARAPRGKLVGTQYEPPESEAIYAPPRTDVQAALSVIGRRQRANDRPMDRPMLIGVNLSGYDFTDGDFTGANFRGSYLCSAVMAGARLAGASLDNSNLESADLFGADCMGASFAGVAAPGSRFAHARLDGANMTDADLRGSDFTRARLEGANLAGTNFDGATFEDATGPDGTTMLLPQFTAPALAFHPGGRSR